MWQLPPPDSNPTASAIPGAVHFDPGAFAIEVDQDNSDAGQLALMTALVSGVAKSFKLLLPNGNTATFTAYVKKFNSQGAVDQAIRRSAELRISGSITWA